MFKDNKWYNFTVSFIRIVAFITICSCIGYFNSKLKVVEYYKYFPTFSNI